jgi:mono/diheme cytochrome c family protein
MRSPYLPRAGVVLLTALWLAPIEIPLFPASPWPARPAAAQDFPPQVPGGQDIPIQDPDDMDAMPRPRAKAARKKARLPEKGAPKKADAKAKTKKDAGTETKAADSGQLKFSQDIAPILVANCVRCHSASGVGVRRGKLDLTTFEKLQKGTPEHKVMVAGNPDESHLVLRVKGDEEPRMPLGNQNRLSEEAIAKIAQWVKEGARLDAGIDPKATLETYAATADQLRQKEVAKLPPAERDKKIEAVGLERWKQANAKLKPEIVTGKQFIMFSNLPKDRATSSIKAMETQYLHLRRSFGVPTTEWVEKVSLYVFSSKNDLIEFVRTVEGRDLDPEEQTTAKLAIPQPYIAAIDPAGGKKEDAAPKRRAKGKRGEESGGADRSLLGLLTEALGAGVVASSSGNSPRWLRDGVGTYMASVVEPRSPYYQQLRQAALGNYQQGWPTKAGETLGGAEQIALADRRAVSFALVECMMKSDFNQGFPAFLHGMLEGQGKLDEMLKGVYNGSREEFLNYTGEWIAAHYGNLQ